MGNTQVIRTVTEDGRVVVNIAWNLDVQNNHHTTPNIINNSAAVGGAQRRQLQDERQRHLQQTSKLAADLYMLTVDIMKCGIISSGPLQIIFDYADLNVQQSTSKTRLYRGRDSDPYTPYLRLNVQHHPNYTYTIGSVKIMVKSKDQGWSDYRHEHGRRTSNTWVYLGLQSDLTASGNNNNEHLIKIVQNIHAGREFETVNKEFNTNNNNNNDDDDKSNENNENVKRLFHRLNSTAKGGGGGGEEEEEAAAAAAAAGAGGLLRRQRGNQDSLVLVTRSKYPGWNCQVKAASIVVVWKPNIAKIEEDWIESLQAKKENITR